MKKTIFFLFLLSSFVGNAQFNIGQVESMQSNDAGHLTTVVTNTSTATELRRIKPENGEAGVLIIYYNAVDGSTGPNQATRIKTVQFKKNAAGVVTVRNAQNLYTNNDAGWNAVDFTVAVSTSDIVINVVGLSGTSIRHTIQTIRVANSLNNSFQ